MAEFLLYLCVYHMLVLSGLGNICHIIDKNRFSLELKHRKLLLCKLYITIFPELFGKTMGFPFFCFLGCF